MRLLLIRHGETVDNVAGNYAGTTDSGLTNHGVLQAQRLGAHLASTGVNASCIFSSDLQRAFKTADAIRLAQSTDAQAVVQLPLLREQDFGSYEGKRYTERPKEAKQTGKDAHPVAHKDDPGFIDVESKESMTKRADAFVNQHLLDLIKNIPEDESIVVVAHGIILNHLWRSVLRLFPPTKTSLAAGVGGVDRGLEYLGGWSNTGYLDLEIRSSTMDSPSGDIAPTNSIQPTAPTAISPGNNSTIEISGGLTAPPEAVSQLSTPRKPASTSNTRLHDRLLIIKGVNCVDHLKGLKKTRGGIGSLKHDSNQKTMDSFFKKRKTE